jgi:MFS family permease
MIFSLLPIFIVEELGGSVRSFGLLEGAVIFLSFIAKIFAGFVMDIFRKKLPMLNIGTTLTIVSKFFLACAPSVFFVFISKSIDRFAKGLRHAPSDAILAEIATKKGYAYSMRYMVNLLGFSVGSVITSVIIRTIGKNFRLIFTLAIIPTLAAWHILKSRIKYDDKPAKDVEVEKQKWRISDIKLLPSQYWTFMVIVVLLMGNRFSEGFITLRAKDVLPENTSNFPLFMTIYEIFAVLTALCVGRFSDKFDKRKILLCGLGILAVADTFGIVARDRFSVAFLYLLSGMHMGATQGILSSIIAEIAPKKLVCTAFMFFYLTEGVTVLCANLVAGVSFDLINSLSLPRSALPFTIGLVPCLAALFLTQRWIKKQPLANVKEARS